jgi:hypothetical protein
MKAIIITDQEARALLDALELKKLKSNYNKPPTPEMEEAHRTYHYVVCKWLGEMGADIVPR